MTSTAPTSPGADGAEEGHDGSVGSDGGTTQTRFSFYNAQDFVAKSPQRTPAAAAAAKAGVESSKRLGAASSAAAAHDAKPGEADPHEILQSLHAHEQQRLDILGVAPASSHSAASDGSNPYEDAIKDALELLRRHRTGIGKHNPPPAIDTTEEGLRGAERVDDVNTSYQSSAHHDEVVEALSRSMDEVNYDVVDAAAATPSSAAAASNTALLGEAYQAEIEARRKQRQERMARYANRLAELKQEDTPQGGAAAKQQQEKLQQTFTPRVESSATDWDKPLAAPPSTRSAPMMSTTTAAATASMEDLPTILTRVSSDNSVAPDDVQRGVERVLLAILERANSRDRGGMIPEFDADTPETNEEDRGSEEKKSASTEQETEEDLLVQAMSDLLGAPSTSTLGSSSPNRNAIQQWMEAAEQELLDKNSDDETNFTGPVQASGLSAAQEPSESQNENTEQDELDEMVFKALNKEKVIAHEDSGEDSFDRRVRSILSQEKGKKDADDDEEEELDSVKKVETDASEENYHTSNEEDETIRSGSFVDDEDSSGNDEAFNVDEGFTDVDDDEDAFNVSEQAAELDGVLGPLSKKAGGTTGVVLEVDEPKARVSSPSILESLSAAMSLVTGRAKEVDKYSPDYDEDDDDNLDEDEDEEARDLMRTLCAHLLPVGVSQSSKLLDKRPAWDESNPDEAGYRIIRLTLPQLAAVERSFDRMVAKVKQKSEKKLSVGGNDAAFERDLRAAEELLDESERQSSDDLNEKAKPKTLVPAHPETFEFAKDVGEGVVLEDFPGVKPTGRGEMGDLEYFTLPIIFKSHVTGFEPTKDISLEPGNIIAGQYLVEGELGTAAFSTAYRCVDLNSSGEGPDDHEEVCLKVIKNTKDFFDQSLDEIKILELLRQTGKCQEKNLVEMKTFFYHREHLIIVTELLRQNLFEFGKFIIDNDEEPYFTMTRLAYMTRQCLVALDFVHQLGLVHSDVKPENILLSSYSRSQVKLIDFGSSCYLTDRQSSYIQSRSYRAPEVVLGLPYDGRIDIWSLGCVVAEMFTGEVTFQNDSIVSMLSRIESICGTFPRHMIAQGRQSGRFFAKSGLLFEKVSADDKESSHNNESDSEDDDSSEPRRQHVDIFQPKTTGLAARLGFAKDLMERADANAKLSDLEGRQALFVDFCRKLLTIDPDTRPTAHQALQHPWMQYADNLPEAQIKYPST
jgi:serine/threonine protein kinase